MPCAAAFMPVIDENQILNYSGTGLSKPGDRSPLAGGKSELYRTGCWVTPRRGDPTDSATETYRPPQADKGEMAR